MSEWEHYVVDAELSGEAGPLCVVPVAAWPHDPVYLAGMNTPATLPPGARMVGIIHTQGHEAVIAWFKRNEARVKALVRETG